VERQLRVLPMPDPLLGLPGIEGSLVGRVVHEVLDGLAAGAGARAGPLKDAAGRRPAAIAWPGAGALEELVAAASNRVAARAGLAPVGMAPLLAARAGELLQVARDLEWSGGPVNGVVGTEVEGAAEVDGWPGRLAFRADRVDRRDDALVLVDYKTGKPLSEAKGEAKRREHLLTKVARGRVLQAAAYARAAGVARARGRYLYLKPNEEWSDEVRELVVEGDDDDLVAAFSGAVTTVAGARERGVAFPRVEEADGRTAEHCQYCAVAEACRRDDSGFRRSLVAWMNRRTEGTEGDDAASARRLWWLGFDRPGGV
jgi:RecB family exonuclease